MRIDRDARPGGPIVTGLTAEGFRVDEAVYRALLLTPERAAEWVPPPLDMLAIADLEPVLSDDPAPEFVLLGTGAALVRPSPVLVESIEARDIGVEAMDSRAAARAWGVLRGEGRLIVAALYPLAWAANPDKCS